MNNAISVAKLGGESNEIPIGAVIVKNKEIIASAHNLVELNKNPCLHAEINVIQIACEKLHSKYLNDCDIYVTLEPCPMCAYAISLAKIRRLYFGAIDKKNGAIVSNLKIYNNTLFLHKPEVYQGIKENECSQILTTFFDKMRNT